MKEYYKHRALAQTPAPIMVRQNFSIKVATLHFLPQPDLIRCTLRRVEVSSSESNYHFFVSGVIVTTEPRYLECSHAFNIKNENEKGSKNQPEKSFLQTLLFFAGNTTTTSLFTLMLCSCGGVCAINVSTGRLFSSLSRLRNSYHCQDGFKNRPLDTGLGSQSERQ